MLVLFYPALQFPRQGKGFFFFLVIFICWVCFAILCSSIGTKLTWKCSLDPGGVDEKRTGIQKRYKQICNILSVERGLSPPDKRNNINFLLRHTLVLVLDLVIVHVHTSFLSVVLFPMSYMYDCGALLHRNYTLQTASAADQVNPNSGCVFHLHLFTFRPILYFADF